MKVLVIGRDGQLSSALEALSCRDMVMTLAGLPELDMSDSAGFAQAAANLVDMSKPDAIINAAAYTAVDKAEDQETLATVINAEAPAILAALAAKDRIPFLHVSTDYVFAGDKDGAYCEDDPTEPTGAYGRSKLAGEIAVMAANPAAMIFRTAWVYSPVGHNFLKTMIRVARDRDTLRVVADQYGSPTYAPDIATTLTTILKNGATGGDMRRGIYHLTGSGATTWHGFATEILKQSAAMGGPTAVVDAITTDAYPTPAQRPANSVLDNSKLRETFGTILPAWQNGVKRCLTALDDLGELR